MLWLTRLNCNISQLQTLEELRQIVANKMKQLSEIEAKNKQQSQEAYTPIYNQLWDQLRQGVSIDDEQLDPLFESLDALIKSEQETHNLIPESKPLSQSLKPKKNSSISIT